MTPGFSRRLARRAFMCCGTVSAVRRRGPPPGRPGQRVPSDASLQRSRVKQRRYFIVAPCQKQPPFCWNSARLSVIKKLSEEIRRSKLYTFHAGTASIVRPRELVHVPGNPVVWRKTHICNCQPSLDLNENISNSLTLPKPSSLSPLPSPLPPATASPTRSSTHPDIR